MVKKIIQIGGKIIVEYSCSMLVVGGAMLVMGNLYRLGKEVGTDVIRLREARRAKKEAKGE
ncbi:MAG: hypothetical protein J6N19_06765 [Clostridium sp.]|nr:hypothetical protein [Clostridium sp.]